MERLVVAEWITAQRLVIGRWVAGWGIVGGLDLSERYTNLGDSIADTIRYDGI